MGYFIAALFTTALILWTVTETIIWRRDLAEADRIAEARKIARNSKK